jgi:hypothetical protein
MEKKLERKKNKGAGKNERMKNKELERNRKGGTARNSKERKEKKKSRLAEERREENDENDPRVFLNKKMGAKEKRKKNKKKLVRALTNPISFGLFNIWLRTCWAQYLATQGPSPICRPHPNLRASSKIRRVRSDPSPKLNEISKLFLFNFSLFN